VFAHTGGSAACAHHTAKLRGSLMARSLLWSCAIAAIHLRGPRADAGKAEAGTALSGVLKLHSNSLPQSYSVQRAERLRSTAFRRGCAGCASTDRSDDYHHDRSSFGGFKSAALKMLHSPALAFGAVRSNHFTSLSANSGWSDGSIPGWVDLSTYQFTIIIAQKAHLLGSW